MEIGLQREMPTALSISRTFTLLSSISISWILSMISGVVTSTGRLQRSASLVPI
uniref:Histonelysine Nmethyltransferase SETMARlike [Bombyx mori] n=1 Tax=Lepeophtheirus salmonis TaxID=72036 RepID=A0A0K2UGZ7_LEPSM